MRRAHDWLTEALGAPPTLFAYPNGDRTEVVASELQRLGYRSAPVFDHQLSALAQDPFALSRLRIDAAAPPARIRAILSGAHSGSFGLRAKARARRTAA